MKAIKNNFKNLIMSSVLLLLNGVLFAFDDKADNGNKAPVTINITGTRFLFPLIERWGQEFNKVQPGVTIVVKQGVSNPDINATAAPIKNQDPNKGKYVTVSRFAIVPIVNSHNPSLQNLQSKGFSEKDFETIYFKKDNTSEKPSAFEGNPLNYRVYSRTACTSATFSSAFGEELKNLKNVGERIENDNLLLETIAKDTLGVAYNDLGIVYDLKTRKPKAGISVVPSDLNGNGLIESSENFYNSLDAVIRNLESTSSNLPPRGDFTLIFKDTKPETAAFVDWILKDGQKYLHEYGFLSRK